MLGGGALGRQDSSGRLAGASLDYHLNCANSAVFQLRHRGLRCACVCSAAARLAGRTAMGGWLPGVRCAASSPTLVSGSGQVAVSSPGAQQELFRRTCGSRDTCCVRAGARVDTGV